MWTIDGSGLQAPPVQAVNRECPHCHALTHLTPVSVPDFAIVRQHRLRRVGVVFRCDGCGSPRFLRFTVRRIEEQHAELAAHGQEIEKPVERFAFNYLPDPVGRLFREALMCHTADCHNAFASMCRRTARAAFTDLGESGRLRMFDTLEDLRRLCDLDADTFHRLQDVIFGGGSDGNDRLSVIDPGHSAVLLEAMKDLLYQTYVRRQKLSRAVKMRRFFADESARKVLPLPVSGPARKTGSD